jgi:ABC-type transport system involved in cytochrome c biogenesis ATPase subunit
MARIDRLVVENYRGASTRLELNFEKDKQVALIFGENGTGKTTIADALDALGNSSKGSLEDRSSTRARDHLPTIGKKPPDVRIEVTAGANTWQTALAGDNLTTTPGACPRIRVLRRNQLQRLLQAQPAQRYEELRRFIDVDAVERSENALREAATTVNATLTAASDRRLEAENQLQEAWTAEGKPDTDALTWAKRAASQDVAKLTKDLQLFREAQTSTSKAEAALAELRGAIATSAEYETEAATIEREVAALPGVDAQQAISLVGILDNVAKHLRTGTHSDECPVCQQAIPLETLKKGIQARLKELKKYDTFRQTREVARRNVQNSLVNVDARRTSLFAAARALLGLSQKAEIGQASGTTISQQDYPELTKQLPGDKELATSQAHKVVGVFLRLRQRLSEAELATTRQSGQLKLISGLYKQVQESVARTEELAALQPALKKAYDVARVARIDFTQKILDDVATECNRLYGLIHPTEPLAISKLALDQGRRASLNQAASFEGHHDVPPQAYFSDSHLDTLGFCFWLATAKGELERADTVVVLDDVFASVDAAHLARIAQLLTDESKHFGHVIATTHQRLWRDIYRYQYGAAKLTQVIELQRWSLAKGISNYRTRLAVDDLIASISAAPFDRQVTSSRAGVLLEAILDYLAHQYRCRVALTHDGSNTLGEFLDGTENLFKTIEIHRPELDSSGRPFSPPRYLSSKVVAIGNQIRALAFLRNQVGAHFNVNGTVISDADVQEFAGLTVKLAEALSCPTCGQLPGKRTGTHFQCSCTAPREARLLPLQY